MLDWNDLRFFLAVARSGSTLSASRELKVSQATVSRRVAVLEEAVAAQLFVRRPSGYELSPRGAAMLPLAEEVERAVLGFESAIAAETRRLTGTVRLTTVESAANSWIIPALRQLRETHPGISVEIITTDANLDLARGEAELAVRFGSRPVQESLVVRHLADLDVAWFASRELAVEHGRPSEFAQLARYPLVAIARGGPGLGAEWLVANLPGAQVVQKVSTISSVQTSVRAGLGAGLLPCVIGDDLPGVVRLMPPVEDFGTQCWLVTTDVARRQPHVRAVIDFVVEQIGRNLRTPRQGEVVIVPA